MVDEGKGFQAWWYCEAMCRHQKKGKVGVKDWYKKVLQEKCLLNQRKRKIKIGESKRKMTSKKITFSEDGIDTEEIWVRKSNW